MIRKNVCISLEVTSVCGCIFELLQIRVVAKYRRAFLLASETIKLIILLSKYCPNNAIDVSPASCIKILFFQVQLPEKKIFVYSQNIFSVLNMIDSRQEYLLPGSMSVAGLKKYCF